MSHREFYHRLRGAEAVNFGAAIYIAEILPRRKI